MCPPYRYSLYCYFSLSIWYTGITGQDNTFNLTLRSRNFVKQLQISERLGVYNYLPIQYDTTEFNERLDIVFCMFGGEMLVWVRSVPQWSMYPYFDICHYILTCLGVKKELSSDTPEEANTFSRIHPMACWLSSMAMCFAGGLLANLLLGKPLLGAVQNRDDLLLATIVWYLIFYSPRDVVSSFLAIVPVNVMLCLSKEVQRVHKIFAGVVEANRIFPGSILSMIVVGGAKGAGSGVVRSFEQFIRGVWVPGGNEFLKPTLATKVSLIGAALFAIHSSNSVSVFSMSGDTVFVALVLFFVALKLYTMLISGSNPFALLENGFCSVFLGGLADSMTQTLAKSNPEKPMKMKKND